MALNQRMQRSFQDRKTIIPNLCLGSILELLFLARALWVTIAAWHNTLLQELKLTWSRLTNVEIEVLFKTANHSSQFAHTIYS